MDSDEDKLMLSVACALLRVPLKLILPFLDSFEAELFLSSAFDVKNGEDVAQPKVEKEIKSNEGEQIGEVIKSPSRAKLTDYGKQDPEKGLNWRENKAADEPWRPIKEPEDSCATKPQSPTHGQQGNGQPKKTRTSSATPLGSLEASELTMRSAFEGGSPAPSPRRWRRPGGIPRHPLRELTPEIVATALASAERPKPAKEGGEGGGGGIGEDSPEAAAAAAAPPPGHGVWPAPYNREHEAAVRAALDSLRGRAAEGAGGAAGAGGGPAAAAAGGAGAGAGATRRAVRQAVLARRQLLLLCVTWNQQARPAPEGADLRAALFGEERYQLVAVGAQECENGFAKSLVVTSKKNWEGQVQEALGPNYFKVGAHTLQATHLALFAHKGLKGLISGVASAAVPTGVGNRLGNKGGVAIRCAVGATRLLLVTAHLAAHAGNAPERNRQYHRIARDLHRTFTGQAVAEGERPLISHFDHVVWGGDLNYRIDAAREAVDEALQRDLHPVLLEYDELYQQMDAKRAFAGYKEGPLNFRPTYKFDKGADSYDSGPKRRVPSWTDRILYKKESGLRLLAYNSAPGLRTSDHRPVYAAFLCPLRGLADPAADAAAAAAQQQGQQRKYAYEEPPRQRPPRRGGGGVSGEGGGAAAAAGGGVAAGSGGRSGAGTEVSNKSEVCAVQ